LYCSRRCRRGKSPATLAAPPVDEAPAAAVEAEEDDLAAAGWRRIGGFLVPPADPRNTITVWHTDGR
jgi:hypothetical protein